MTASTVTDTVQDWSFVEDGLLDAAWYAQGEPREALARLREKDPVHWAEPRTFDRPFWIVTSYEHVAAVLDDPIAFSSYRGSRPPRVVERLSGQQIFDIGQDAFIPNMDPPQHTVFRRPINKHFSVPSIARLRSQIEAIVDDLIAEAGTQDSIEFVEGLGGDVPMNVVLEFLGVPREDWDMLRGLVWQALAPADPRFTIEGRTPVETMVIARTQLNEYSVSLCRQRRAEPKDDFATVMSTIEIEGTRLDDHELAAWYSIIIIAGLESTRNAAAMGLWLFDRHRDQLALALENPDLWPSAVDEVLRWVTPVRARLRIARFDTELAGKSISAGDWVIPVISAANHDPSVFADPGRFDIRRDPNPYLSLGHGVHKCLGRALVRLELSILYRKFFAAFPDFSLPSGDTPDFILDHVMNGLVTLPVQLRD